MKEIERVKFVLVRVKMIARWVRKHRIGGPLDRIIGAEVRWKGVDWRVSGFRVTGMVRLVGLRFEGKRWVHIKDSKVGKEKEPIGAMRIRDDLWDEGVQLLAIKAKERGQGDIRRQVRDAVSKGDYIGVIQLFKFIGIKLEKYES